MAVKTQDWKQRSMLRVPDNINHSTRMT